MQYFPTPLSKTESDALAKTLQSMINQYCWGIWAVEFKTTQQFIGFTGLCDQPKGLEFSPCVEIGSRFAKQYWHQGLATEAAQASLDFAFQELQLKKSSRLLQRQINHQKK